MRRALTLILGVALFGILAAVVVASQGADDPAGTTDTVTETVERTTTVEDNPNRVRDDDNQAEDISGPCDEAEHAGDPHCTGQQVGQQDDGQENEVDNGQVGQVDNSGPGSHNSGPGSVNSGRDDEGDDDRGEVEVDDDHGGHGGHGGDDDGGDAHGGESGHGGGHDD